MVLCGQQALPTWKNIDGYSEDVQWLVVIWVWSTMLRWKWFFFIIVFRLIYLKISIISLPSLQQEEGSSAKQGSTTNTAYHTSNNRLLLSTQTATSTTSGIGGCSRNRARNRRCAWWQKRGRGSWWHPSRSWHGRAGDWAGIRAAYGTGIRWHRWGSVRVCSIISRAVSGCSICIAVRCRSIRWGIGRTGIGIGIGISICITIGGGWSWGPWCILAIIGGGSGGTSI